MGVHPPPWPQHRAGEMAVVAILASNSFAISIECEQGLMEKNGLASA
jgi:hypothetical protein